MSASSNQLPIPADSRNLPLSIPIVAPILGEALILLAYFRTPAAKLLRQGLSLQIDLRHSFQVGSP